MPDSLKTLSIWKERVDPPAPGGGEARPPVTEVKRIGEVDLGLPMGDVLVACIVEADYISTGMNFA